MKHPDTQEHRLQFLLEYLLREREEYQAVAIPEGMAERQRLLRSLMNVRPPLPVSREFLQVQDAYLQARLAQRGVTRLEALTPVRPGLYLWQGDITTLGVDAIVNAANSQLLGCFVPCHRCIDNAIHTYAGVQLRLECQDIMAAQGGREPTGQAKLTGGYNLPCRYVLHTVGPVIDTAVTPRDRELLASCYRSCLDLAARHGVKSVAFCCISTGEFHFPNQLAATIAVETVEAWREAHPGKLEVIFNVFQDKDRDIYQALLG